MSITKHCSTRKIAAACERTGCHPAADYAERFGIGSTGEARTRSGTVAKTQRGTRGGSQQLKEAKQAAVVPEGKMKTKIISEGKTYVEKVVRRRNCLCLRPAAWT